MGTRSSRCRTFLGLPVERSIVMKVRRGRSFYRVITGRSSIATSPLRRHDSPSPKRPTRAEVLAAAGRTVREVVREGLRVLFCGINPGLYSGAVGHHFARPGNRFWPVLHAAGFTPRVLTAWEERELLEWGYGITNLVNRTTAAAAELDHAELRRGARH